MRSFPMAALLAGALLFLPPGGAARADILPLTAVQPGSTAGLLPAASAGPQVLLDGLPLRFPMSPVVEEGATWVPLETLSQALGECRAAVPSTFARDGTQMVPLRAFSEACGATVTWEAGTRTVSLISPVRAMRTLGFYAIRSYPELTYVPAFSDVAYGWATLTSAGEVDLTAGEYRWPEPDGDVTGERLLADAAAVGTRRHLMIQAVEGTTDLSGLVQDPQRITKAAAGIVAAVTEKGFDGVVLDLEGLGDPLLPEEEIGRTRQGFVSLVQAVATPLRAAGKETIVSVPPLNGWYEGYDYAQLAGAADLLQVMAHDYRQDGGPEPWELVDEAIQLAVAQVGEGHRQQLLLGIVSSYETPETLWQKAGLAKRYNLGGLSVWRLGEIGSERMQAMASTVIRTAGE